MADTTARVLRLLSLFQAHRVWTGTELAERLDVSERTIRRDVDRLRELGYPVVATTGPTGGYQLVAGKTMPPLLLDDEEALAIAVSLLTAAGGTVGGIEEASVRALAKLQQVLPPRVRDRVSSVQETVTPVVRSWVTVDASILSCVAQACRDHERIRFEYQDRDGNRSDRNVEPHQLVMLDQRWYLVGFDRERNDWRTFRIDRMDEPFLTKRTFEPREIPGGDASLYVLEARAAMPSRFHVELVIHAPADQIAPKISKGSGSVEPIGPDRCLLTLRADSIQSIAFTLFWLDVDYELSRPSGPPGRPGEQPADVELMTYMERLGGRIARLIPA